MRLKIYHPPPILLLFVNLIHTGCLLTNIFGMHDHYVGRTAVRLYKTVYLYKTVILYVYVHRCIVPNDLFNDRAVNDAKLMTRSQ